jgi:glycosyltransferase involved in cell wall biosynthesis
MSQPKIALVHDYLHQSGEAERVLLGLHRLYPDAPIYTAFFDRAGLNTLAPGLTQQHDEPIPIGNIHPSFAQTLPCIHHRPETYHLLLPYIWESFDLRAYDLVISSSHTYLSHAVLTGPHTLHVCYCHQPAPWLWGRSPAQKTSKYQAWLHSRLRHYDFYAAQHVDRFVTNSERVARRIANVYRKSAEVISPPVTMAGNGCAGERHLLYLGPLAKQAQVDLLVQACSQINCPLQVIGTGPELTHLQAMAGPSIQFLGQPSPAELVPIYANAMGLIFPQLQVDFSSIPVEAMGRGLPVIAYQHSGMAEIVLHYRTGLLFQEPTVDSLAQTIEEFQKLRFFSQACLDRAKEFSEANFRMKFDWYVTQALDDY